MDFMLRLRVLDLLAQLEDRASALCIRLLASLFLLPTKLASPGFLPCSECSDTEKRVWDATDSTRGHVIVQLVLTAHQINRYLETCFGRHVINRLGDGPP